MDKHSDSVKAGPFLTSVVHSYCRLSDERSIASSRATSV